MKKTLPVDLLKLDGGTQSRISIDEDTVAEYAELIEASEDWPFPPLDVFHDGTDHFVADGFHRTLGASRAKRSSLPCVIHKGTATDARIFGMTANDRHGLRMTRADKRACVEWLLDNGGKMTQREIAEKAGVSKRMVSFIVADRREVDITPTPPKPVTPRGNAQIAHTPPEGPADESIPDDVFGDRHDEPPEDQRNHLRSTTDRPT